jgi:hypothetical protein
MLNTIYDNAVRRVSKCLETGEEHFEHYSYLSVFYSSGAQRLFDHPVLNASKLLAPSRLAQSVTHPKFIRKVPESNLGCIAGYPTVFSWFSRTLLAHEETVPLIKLRPLPDKSFQVRYSVILSHFTGVVVRTSANIIQGVQKRNTWRTSTNIPCASLYLVESVCQGQLISNGLWPPTSPDPRTNDLLLRTLLKKCCVLKLHSKTGKVTSAFS